MEEEKETNTPRKKELGQGTESATVKTPVPHMRCELCDIELTSATQLTLHETGRKHKNKAGIGGTQSKGENVSALTPSKDAKNQDRKVVIIKSLSEMEWALKKATSSKDSDVGIKSKVEEQWFRENECYCGVCLVLIESRKSAFIHFTGIKHKGRAKKDGEDGGEPEEWCKICRVDLASSYAANLHYKGEKHRNKIIIVSTLSAFDEDIADRLNPMRKKDYQPGYGYLNNKRPSFNQIDSTYSSGTRHYKRGLGAINHLYSSFVPGGTIIQDNSQQHGYNSPSQSYNGYQQSYKDHNQDNNDQGYDYTEQQGYNEGNSKQQCWKARQHQGIGFSPGEENGRARTTRRSRGAKLKQFNTPRDYKNVPPTYNGVPVKQKNTNSKKTPARNEFHCGVCDLTLNSNAQMEIHLAGKSHAKMVTGKG